MCFQVNSNVHVDLFDKWTKFIQQHPDGNPFQSPEMYELAVATKNWKPVLVSCVDGKGDVCGVMLAIRQNEWFDPFGLLTGRTVIWGGPLIAVDGQEERQKIFGLMLKSLRRELRFKSIYTQFRSLFVLEDLSQVFKENGFECKEHLNFIVEIDRTESVKRRISKSKLRQIRKSFKDGAEIVEPGNIEEVRSFYKILKDLYRKKIKKPLPDWSFFREFFHMSCRGVMGKYFLIQFQNEIIGGIMCPITQGKGIYEWYVCGQDNKYKGIYPSVLATWAPIEYGLNHGLRFFNFMGAGKPDNDYGVREFKSKFGGRMVGFGRFEKIEHRIAYNMGRFGINLLEKI